jgi:hypothetical protein
MSLNTFHIDVSQFNSLMNYGKYYCYLSSRIGSEFIPANFPLPYFACQIIDSAHLFPWIHLCPIYTDVPPIILQCRFGPETIWIK